MIADEFGVQSPIKAKPTGCCGDTLLIDASKMELPFDLKISVGDFNLWISVLTIMFNPIFWNVVARWEHRNRTLTKIFKSPKTGCIFLGITIFCIGIFRDYRFNLALESQPKWPLLYENWILLLGYGCICVGMTFVLTSYWALGFYGTFLGDYFGILMDRRVTEFPFSICEDPMYVGSTLSFLGTSLIKASQAGLFLTSFVAICYKIATRFEGSVCVIIVAGLSYRDYYNLINMGCMLGFLFFGSKHPTTSYVKVMSDHLQHISTVNKRRNDDSAVL